jgi:hypothetical protein
MHLTALAERKLNGSDMAMEEGDKVCLLQLLITIHRCSTFSTAASAGIA